MPLTADKVITACSTLRSAWVRREKKFRDWYEQIELVDTLNQENMESFVSSDPRSAYNLLLHMINNPRIPHRIPPELVTPELVIPAGNLSRLLDVAWSDVFNRYRLTGKQSWMRDMIGFELATGWYSVFANISQDGSRCIAELLNPAEVFPSYDDTLTECARVFTISPGALTRMAARNKWTMRPVSTAQTIYDYWWTESNNMGEDTVYNCIVAGSTLVKPETVEARFSRIPIFTSPVGGLPDTGLLSTDPTMWREEVGQSSVATAETVYRSMNKWWTFSMQLLRDTAQSRWYEKTAGGKPILKREDLYKRGFIARMGPNDEIGPLPVPPIPVELRSMQLDMEAMLQRAGPPWALYGASVQNMTAYMMSQVASGAAQMAQPYHQGVIDVLTDIDNFWLDLIRKNNYKPYNLDYPKEIPDSVRVSAAYEIRIPGDIIQRATVARMLDPDFRISSTRVMEELFPEVKSPMEEKAQIRADQAESHPVRGYIALVLSLRQEAQNLLKSGDREASRLYDLAATAIETQLGVTAAPPQPGQQAQPPGPRPEVSPNRERMINPTAGTPGETVV